MESIIYGWSMAFAAHIFDYYVTLKISPDLSFEANPLWLIVVHKMGLNAALWYGLTGKIILSVLSFEFFAYYLIHRKSLIPKQSDSFLSFCRNFGRNKRSKRLNLIPMLNFFSFLFSLLGLFCLYVALLNSITDESLYLLMPSMPLMLLVYLFVLVATSFVVMDTSELASNFLCCPFLTRLRKNSNWKMRNAQRFRCIGCLKLLFP